MTRGLSPLLIFEIVAVVLGALSAMITASKKNLDFVGTYALAVVTSFGGGTIRDVLLDRRPFFWVSRWEYLIIIFALCIPFVYSRRVHDWSRQLVARGEFVDALGLGFFSVVGVTMALDAKLPAAVAVLMGVVTATGGGIIRDLLVNEIPVVFRHGSTLYTTSAFAGAVVFIALQKIHSPFAVFASVSVAVASRLYSVWKGTSLPRPLWMATGSYRVPTAEHPTEAGSAPVPDDRDRDGR
ncbi:MAG: trimeric intracellular cation channel family protein [Gemmatimonadota bacterium]|nr:trimeric intracellular cation channel family protein [Gemmatimonadota bacterium]